MTNKIIVLIVFSCLLWSDVAGQGFMRSYHIAETGTGHADVVIADTSGYLIQARPDCTLSAICTGLIKVNTIGIKQWDNLFASSDFWLDPALNMIKLTDNTYTLLGGIYHPDILSQAFFLKIGGQGDSLSFKEYGNISEQEVGRSIVVKNDSLLAAVNTSEGALLRPKLLTMCTDFSGLMEVQIPNINNFLYTGAYDISLSIDSSALYLNTWCKNDQEKTYLIVRKLQLAGDIMWSYALPGYTTATNTPTQIVALPNGNIVTHWFDEGNGGSSTERNPYLICLSPNDSLVWRYNFNDDGYKKFPIAISVAANGDIIGCGYTQRPDYDYDCGWLFRVSSSGELLWEREYIGYTPLINFLLLEGIDEDADGNIVATGMVVDPTPIGGYEGNALLLKVLPNGCFTPDCAGGGEDTLIVASTVLGVESAPKPSSASSVFSLLLYPNPATDVVSLFLPNSYSYNNSSAAVVVCDLSGRVLRRFDLGSGGASGSLVAIPTHDLVNGMYVVQYIEAGRVKGVGKMVVLR